jgi:hypothetical protein
MPQTGNYFIDNFSLVCIFLPLLPVILVFFRRIYHFEALNFLMILCLLNFLKGILLLIPDLVIIHRNTISTIFALAELVILLLVFRTLFSGRLRYLLTFFMIAFLSSLLTFYFLKGITIKREYLEEIQEGVILIFSLLGLFEMVDKEDLLIFQSPLLWITIGTIFYFSISLLIRPVESLSVSGRQPSGAANQFLLDIALSARYLFYLLAGWFYQAPGGKRKKENFS